MNWKDRVVLTIYTYKAELGMAALSIAFGLFFLDIAQRIILIPSSSVKALAAALLLVGVLRTVGVVSGSYFVRKWTANFAVVLWSIFFAISLYISSDFSIILLALLVGAIVVRTSQKIERRMGNNGES